jgi:hypothetical protein
VRAATLTTHAGSVATTDLPKYIGRYRIIERIGKGAMGMVFAAEDENLGRRVAVKVMMGDLEDEPEMRGRFFREAKITGQLAHRNIVTVFDLGEDDRRPFIVMELLSGLPLAAYLRTPAAEPLERKLDLMMQICTGLQVAHSKGVVHRDIKPSNLFVQHDGSIKILDFGVARLASSSLTKSGFVVGTPEYMSPEQAQGRYVDARSDVFSASGVFYFMLSGRGPFSTPDLPKMLHAVVHEDPPTLSEAEAPDVVRRVLMKGLAKAPTDRYQQCADLLGDLARARRSYEGATHRVTQAAVDRYRQVIATIEERRALGRTMGRAEIDRAGADSITRLAKRFPDFARYADPSSLLEPMDRKVAQDALLALQTRHNAELASLGALRAEASDVMARSERGDGGQTADHPSDATSHGSLKKSAAALWRRLGRM